MSNRELSLAIFYNFKDEVSCPLCRLVKTVYDKGGVKLVLERLGVLDSDRFEHSFPKCFLHYYWLTQEYNEVNNPRPVRIIVDEGFQIFKVLKKILSIM